ncbi:prolipoprotein diacylglyceryl transferase [Limoniibacter endophyticus]|nr:prolipoprotein diacylglyceryl transferase [Limoniibacter endophyticus]
MPMTALAFPDISPIALQLGPIAIHWYGVGYIVGILFAWWYAKRLVSNDALWLAGQPRPQKLDIDDFVMWAAIGVVLGGRVGYILFYDLPRYLANPLDIFKVWEGGMSFHGGFLGTTLAMIFFARSRKIPVWTMFDVVAAGVPVALGLVRIANFINSELWGRPTDHSWGVIFPTGGPIPRHPSQLYEAFLEGFVLFIVLIVLIFAAKRLKRPGFIAGTFVFGYGLSRIAAEFFREPDAQIGYLAGNWLTMGMVLSVPMVLAGLAAMGWSLRKRMA